MADNEVTIDPNAGKTMFYTFDDSGNYTGSTFSVNQPTNSTETPPTKPYTDETGAIVAGIEIGLTNPIWDNAAKQWVERQLKITLTDAQKIIINQAQQLSVLQQIVMSQAADIAKLNQGVDKV